MMIVNSGCLSNRLKKGVQILAEFGFLQEKEEGFKLHAILGNEIVVEKSQSDIYITYNNEPHFYMALARSMVMEEGTHFITQKAKRLGFMLDCSRNAVMKLEMVKQYICMLVMAGYDYLEIYTEDTYELPDEPYFGHMRGRYRKEELQEIVAFADMFQFEMVPCIQTLAHLRCVSLWKPYIDHMDHDDILLTNDERTYNLIRKSLRYCKDIFHTKRVNIGSDEAYHLGRGAYTDIYGYKNTHKVYLEHMKKVFDICKEEGVEPEFWADAFYNTDQPEEEIKSLFDGTQLPIVWRYRHTEAEQARTYLKQVKKYAGKVMYAGACCKYLSYAPNNLYTEQSIDALFAVAEECDVDDIFMTSWGNDGNECSVHAIMPSMWYAAHKLFPSDINLSDMILTLTGYTKEEWELCDKLNYVMPRFDRHCNAAKYLLYNDFLIGLMDYNIPDHAAEIYQNLLPEFKALTERESRFSYLFVSYEALCRVLARKATYGKRLYKAYHEKDKEGMRMLLEDLSYIQEDLRTFYNAFREQWMKENKGFGFEVIDIRLGGLIGRIDTVTNVLKNYLDGKTEKIYELEEERLDFSCGQLKGEDIYAMIQPDWATAYTANLMLYYYFSVKKEKL